MRADQQRQGDDDRADDREDASVCARRSNSEGDRGTEVYRTVSRYRRRGGPTSRSVRLRGSRLGLLLEELLERGVVERGDAQIEEDVEQLVARDQITRRKPLERHIDEIDETSTGHDCLRSLTSP